MAQLYTVAADLPKKLTLLQPLVDADPARSDYRQAWAETMIELGRAPEALEVIARWVAEKPGEQRWTLLSQLQARAGRIRDARASLVQAVESADKVRKTDLKIQLAHFDTEQGDVSEEREALKANFLGKKDARTFQGYWRFLDERGWPAEAHTLFVTNRESGFFQQYQQNDFVAQCLNQSDYSSAADLNWRFTRYGERWERDWYFDRVAKVYRERGKMRWFVNDFAQRIEKDGASNESLAQRVARSWEQSGFPDKAFAIYDRQLEKNPFNRTASESKAGLLVKLGRTDEAIAILRSSKGITTLEVESNASVALISTLLNLGRQTEATQEIQSLLAWDKRPNTLMRVGNLLMDNGQANQALTILEQATGSLRDWNYDEVLMSLAKCRAKVGQADDLMKLTQELMTSSNAEWRLQSLQAWLASEGFYKLAAQLVEYRLAKTPTVLDLYTTLAGLYQSAGDSDRAFATYEKASTAVAKELQGNLRAALGNFLYDFNLITQAVARLETPQGALLADALVDVLGRTEAKSERTRILESNLDKLKPNEAELQFRLAQALVKLHRDEDAVVWFKRALESTNDFERTTAAVGLARLTGDKAAAAVLSEALDRYPHWFTGREWSGGSFAPMPVVSFGPYYGAAVPYSGQPSSRIDKSWVPSAIARSADMALMEKYKTVMASAALWDSDIQLPAVLLEYHRGKTNEVRRQLTALAAAPKINGASLQTLIGLLEESGLRDEQIQALSRLAQGGYGAQTRSQAMADLVKVNAKARDYEHAVGLLAELLGTWGTSACEQARAALVDAVDSEHYGAFRSAVLKAVRTKPEADVDSSLLGWCAQIGQRIGLDETAEKLAAEAKVNEMEREEAAAWDTLVEQWEIAGPFRTQGSDNTPSIDYGSMMGTIGMSLKAKGLAVPKEAVWVKTDPRKELGVIQIGPLLGLQAGETGGQSAWARTTLVSPEDQRVTFAVGSDDTVRVWVNGELVHSYLESRTCALDQDRFTATLKKGNNQIVLQIGNISESWNFCFRIVEGARGTTLAAVQ